MKTTRMMQAVLVAAVCALTIGAAGARQGSTATVAVDGDDIGGVVTGPKGPEAGVWVIAETTELPTRFVRIVVTDDRDGIWSPICRKRPIASGFGDMASSIPRRRKCNPERA